ncbi:MAG: hypothetical protein AAFR44_13610 [Pseudomonadota bacterium]
MAFGCMAALRPSELLGPEQGRFDPKRSLHRDAVTLYFGEHGCFGPHESGRWPSSQPELLIYCLEYAKNDKEGEHPNGAVARRTTQGDDEEDFLDTVVNFLVHFPPREGKSLFDTPAYSITHADVMAAIRATVTAVGLPAERFNIKSLRSALPTAMRAAGAPDEDIKLVGPWRSDQMVRVYAKANAAAAAARANALADPRNGAAFMSASTCLAPQRLQAVSLAPIPAGAPHVWRA